MIYRTSPSSAAQQPLDVMGDKIHCINLASSICILHNCGHVASSKQAKRVISGWYGVNFRWAKSTFSSLL